ncbi:MAG: YtxH domain-containing protein [Cyclobacteriaceae bacterium]|nr:YtxH domain-containing protein [Cyclobacteriaceae bacterium]
MKNGKLKVAAGFVVGTLAGVAIGYLTAPSSGKSTREKIIKKGDDITGEIKGYAEEKVAMMKDLYNESINKMTGKGKKSVEEDKNLVSAN